MNGAGWSPVDQREPVERVVADGAHKAILTPAVDLQHIKLALGGIETEDQAVDISMQQLRLRGNHHIRVLLLAGVAPRHLPCDEGTHMVPLGREEALRAVIDPAPALRG